MPGSRLRIVVVATVAAVAAFALPYFVAAGDGGPVLPSGDSTPVDTTVPDATTTAVDTTTVDSSTAVDSTAVDSTVPDSTTTTPPPPVVVAAAGDISCQAGQAVTATGCHAGTVSDRLVAETSLEHFLALGDEQYNGGALDQFQRSYDLTYGRIKAITRPVPGNHEYHTRGAAGYFAYFAAAAGTPGEGWYSFDVGSTWHIVALNSNCGDVGCDATGVQEQWLRTDLAASERPCTLAFWHHPLFSSGAHHGGDSSVAPLWEALLDDGAEIVLSAHEHLYERFAPQATDGTASNLGIREFVVGTGGKSQYDFADPPAANSEVRLVTFGYLRLALSDGGYSFEFVGEDGAVLDSGAGTCR